MSWESSGRVRAHHQHRGSAAAGRSGHSADLLVRFLQLWRYSEQLQEHRETGTVQDNCWRRMRVTFRTQAPSLILLCTNTMHLVAPAIESAIDVPFLPISQTRPRWRISSLPGVVDAVALAGHPVHHGDGLLSRSPRVGYGLRVLDPKRGRPHRCQRCDLRRTGARGRVLGSSREAYLAIIDRLGCCWGARSHRRLYRRSGLLVTPDDVAIPYFPTTRIHALAAVDCCASTRLTDLGRLLLQGRQLARCC